MRLIVQRLQIKSLLSSVCERLHLAIMEKYKSGEFFKNAAVALADGDQISAAWLNLGQTQ